MKPLLYQRSSNGFLALSFVATIAIYASALAFSPTQAPPSEVSTAALPEVDLEPAAQEPQPEPSTSEPIDSITTTMPNDFYDSPEPTPKRIANRTKPLRPVRPTSTTPRSRGMDGKLFAVVSPRPIYPYEARKNHVTGSGAVILDVDPTTGAVRRATISETTGSAILDNSAVSAFRNWRFRSGTAPRVKIPFTFTIFGAQL